MGIVARALQRAIRRSACSPTGAPLARFPFNGQLFVDEKAVILLEIYRKDGKPSIQVCAEVNGKKTGEDVATDVYEGLSELRSSLPPGYAIKYDGVSDDSDVTTGLFLDPVPIMAAAGMGWL